MKKREMDLTIQQEACEKIMKLPEDGIKLILAMADEIARQHGIVYETDSETEENILRLQS
ncbi:MAG: hypothetical protein HFI29_13165 [Lachnospiraceae bacterium]|nr:hypothetical protein [Lachnospiraceae bacterium]